LITMIMFCKECISSINDEECSKMHYALWIAEFRELTDVWMLLVPLGYSWRCAWFNANCLPYAIMLLSIAVNSRGQCVCIEPGCCAAVCNLNMFSWGQTCFVICWLICVKMHIWNKLNTCIHLAWSEAHKPAEFKHISKWWKLNQMGFL